MSEAEVVRQAGLQMLWRGFDFGYTGSALSGGIKVKSHTVQWERGHRLREPPAAWPVPRLSYKTRPAGFLVGKKQVLLACDRPRHMLYYCLNTILLNPTSACAIPYSSLQRFCLSYLRVVSVLATRLAAWCDCSRPAACRLHHQDTSKKCLRHSHKR